MPGQKIYLSDDTSVQSQNKAQSQVSTQYQEQQTQSTVSAPKNVATPVQTTNQVQSQTTTSVLKPTQSAQPVKNVNVQSSEGLSESNASAKAWIAQHESGGNYNATNGQYIGKYQLSAGYLHGDYSPANQERCADQYVANRYGNWVNAQQHWENYGWY